MPRVIVNPDELRRFAVYLNDLREQLQHRRFSTEHAFEQLRQNWRDAKYDAFARTFQETCRDLNQFLTALDTYAEFLRRKAALADRYLRGS